MNALGRGTCVGGNQEALSGGVFRIVRENALKLPFLSAKQRPPLWVESCSFPGDSSCAEAWGQSCKGGNKKRKFMCNFSQV